MRFRLRSGNALSYGTGGTGMPMVLLHPIGLNRHFWNPVIPELARNALTIAVDLPGHGDSDVVAGDYSIRALAADCSELIEALAGSAVVVGCSMGASVAQLMAADHPETVAALVLANTSGPREQGRTDTLRIRAEEARKGMAEVAEAMVDRWFSEGFKQECPGEVGRIKAMLVSGDPFVHARAWEALADRPDDHYGRIEVPVLTIAGSEDPSASPQAVRGLAAAIEGAKFIEISGAGHLAPVEQPQAFAAAVRTFIEQNIS